MKSRRAILGQYFLRNREAIQRVIRALAPKKGETVIEIGPGKGALTLPLGRACESRGARLVGIEKDPDLVREVKHRIEEAKLTDAVRIERGDALKILASHISHLASPYKLAGNIPYAITGRLLRTIGELETKPQTSVFMVQREVAERITGEAPRMNLLAASVRFWTHPRIVMNLAEDDFFPPPRVKSALIELALRPPLPVSPRAYYALIHALFRQPRKTIINNLSAGLKRPKHMLRPMLEAAGCAPESRPQDCGFELLINLASRLAAYGIL